MPRNPQWAQELKKQGINYTVASIRPVSMNTGAGPDGIVQPRRTAMIDYGTNPPSKYHEGEQISVAPNGVRTITPAQQVFGQQIRKPMTIAEQGSMDQMPLPGYYDGGTTTPVYDPITTIGRPIPTGTTVGGATTNTTTGTTVGDSGRSAYGEAMNRRSAVERQSAYGDAMDRSAGALGDSGQSAYSEAMKRKAEVFGRSTIDPPLNDRSTTHTTSEAGGSPVQSPLNTLASGAVETGLKSLTQTATGNNPYLNNYGNKQLTDLSAAGAAGNRATIAQAKRAGVSTPIMTTIAAEAQRSAENAQGNLRSDIYGQQQRAALDAANNLVQQGQQVRAYEDVTLPGATRAQETFDLEMKNATDSSVKNRMVLLYKADKSLDKMLGDGELRSAIKDMMGSGADESAIDNEIKTRWNALQDENYDLFKQQADDIIDDIIDNDGDINQAYADEDLRAAVAGKLKLDVNDTSDDVQKKIRDEIYQRFMSMNKSDADRIYDDWVHNYVEPIRPDLLKNPEFKQHGLNVIGDLMEGGHIINGKINPDYGFLWPDKDSRTFFKYNDWNGNYVPDGKYNANEAITIEGNGTVYKTSSGNPVTHADLNAKWDKLGPADKERYFDENRQIKVDAFLRDQGFYQNTDGDTQLISYDDFEDLYLEDESYKKAMGTNIDEFISAGYKTGDRTVGDDPETAQTEDASLSAKFVYYDADGIQQEGELRDFQFAYIWEQVSRHAGLPQGELLDPESFSKLWNKNRDTWRVDSNTGKVLNLWDKDAASGPNLLFSALQGSSVYEGADAGSLKWPDGTHYGYESLRLTDKDIPNIVRDLQNLRETQYTNPDYNKYLTTPITTPNGEMLFVEDEASVPATTIYTGNKFTDELKQWVSTNQGKPYISQSGKLYFVSHIERGKKDKDWDKLWFYDPVTQSRIEMNQLQKKDTQKWEPWRTQL